MCIWCTSHWLVPSSSILCYFVDFLRPLFLHGELLVNSLLLVLNILVSALMCLEHICVVMKENHYRVINRLTLRKRYSYRWLCSNMCSSLWSCLYQLQWSTPQWKKSSYISLLWITIILYNPSVLHLRTSYRWRFCFILCWSFNWFLWFVLYSVGFWLMIGRIFNMLF